MNFLRSRLVQAGLILIAAFVVLRFGIRPPAPWSVVQLYMTIVLLAVLIYDSADSDSWREFVHPIRSTIVERDKRHVRLALLVVVRLLLGYYAYRQAAGRPQAQPELRALHSSPPAPVE